MNKEALIAVGVNYEQGVDRFVGNEMIYEKLLKKLLETDIMNRLYEALFLKDYEEAFKIAHDLKGNTGNMSMGKMYDKVCEMVEMLRNGNVDDSINDMYDDALKIWNETKDAADII